MAGGRSFDPWSESFPWREVMEHVLGSPSRPGPMVAGVGVPVDVADVEDAYVVYAVIPGVDPEALDVRVEDERVLLRGEVREPTLQGHWVSRERRFGQFQRTIVLPGPVDAERAEARYEHGVLVVRLPKEREPQARRIPIRRG